MKELLEKICALQPKYAWSNTPDMQERGRLIRHELPNALREHLSTLSGAFDTTFDDLAVEGSDGIGRKTEAPWVRIFSKAMSPNPREGFYLVIHFAADGSAIFITIGCGSTVWHGGDLTAVSDEELQTRTSWARSVVQHRWGTLDPFADEIELGAKAALPRTFEKATAFARRISTADLRDVDLEFFLFEAAKRLGEIYLAQLEKRDMSPGDRDVASIEKIAKPLKRGPNSQGRGLTAAERKVVEHRAMEIATQHLIALGFECQDTSATESFDVLAKRANEMIMVEVKGTTSDLCDSILMTWNEVELHRTHKGLTGILIVSKIRLSHDGDGPSANGGEVEALLKWDIDEWTRKAVAFQVSRSS